MTALTTTTATPTVEEGDIVNRSTYITATLSTTNSRYLLVKREGWVLLVKDGDRTGISPIGVGDPIKGALARFEYTQSGRYVLRVYDVNGRLVFGSSSVESIYILEN